MKEQLRQYVNLLFAGAIESEDIKQEILQNTLERYDDLIEQGKNPQAAYQLAISGIGDIGELLQGNHFPAPAVQNTKPQDTGKKKFLRAVAIAMYITCVVPVIALGDIGNGIIGVCLMFLMIAAATVLIILSSDSNSKEDDQKKKEKEPSHPAYKTYKSVSGIFTLVIYLLASFETGAWHVTWLIFPISAAVDGLVKAIFDLKEVIDHEA